LRKREEARDSGLISDKMPALQPVNPSGELRPPIEWAQRKDTVLLTIQVEDCKEPQIDVQPTSLHFKGFGGAERHTYEGTIEFYAEVNPEKVKKAITGRSIELVIHKKESGPYWPRLTKDKAKVHWIKVDFTKWKDSDDEEEKKEDYDLNDMMGQMGGLSSDDKPDLGDFDDSDNEDLPDLEDAAEGKTDKSEKEEEKEKKNEKTTNGESTSSTATTSG